MLKQVVLVQITTSTDAGMLLWSGPSVPLAQREWCRGDVLLNHRNISPNRFSCRGSYFKLGSEGSQNFVESLGGGCHTGCRWRCNLLMCVRLRVRRSNTGQGFADLRDGGVIWRAYGWGFVGENKFLYLFGQNLYLYFGLFLAQKYIYGRRCILWIGLKQIAEYRWYITMLFGVYVCIVFISWNYCYVRSFKIEDLLSHVGNEWLIPTFFRYFTKFEPTSWVWLFFQTHENHNWTLRESFMLFMLRWAEWGNNTKQDYLNLLESED